MSPTPLTEKETKVFEYIKNFSNKKGFPPTYAEIQEKFGYKALSSVQQFIGQLVDKGYLKAPIGESKKRALELVLHDEGDCVQIPMEGKVAAGRLTEAVNNREYVEIPKNLLKAGTDYFALTVKGDSMIEDCIMDGDLVVIKRVHEASNGQTVVALVNEEATIKRYYKRKNRVELHPANSNYNIIFVEPEAEFKILGVLSSVIRRCE